MHTFLHAECYCVNVIIISLFIFAAGLNGGFGGASPSFGGSAPAALGGFGGSFFLIWGLLLGYFSVIFIVFILNNTAHFQDNDHRKMWPHQHHLAEVRKGFLYAFLV